MRCSAAMSGTGNLRQRSLHTPVSDLSVAEAGGPTVSNDWGWGSRQEETRLPRRARAQLHAYLDGALRKRDLPLAPAGTHYQRRVRQALPPNHPAFGKPMGAAYVCRGQTCGLPISDAAALRMAISART